MEKSCESAVAAPIGDGIVFADRASGQVFDWSLETGLVSRRMKTEGRVNDVAVWGRNVILGGTHGVRVCSLETNQSTDSVTTASHRDPATFDGPAPATVAVTAVSPDGVIAMAGTDGSLTIRQGDNSAVMTVKSPVLALTWSSKGCVLAIGTADGRVSFVTFANGALAELRAPLLGNSLGATALAFSKDSKLLAVGRSNGRIELYATNDNGVPDDGAPSLLEGHSRERVSQLAFSPRCDTLASSAADELLLWDVTTLRISLDFPELNKSLDRIVLVAFVERPDSIDMVAADVFGRAIVFPGRQVKAGGDSKAVSRLAP